MTAEWTERWVELREYDGEFFAYETGILSVDGAEFWVDRMISGPHMRLAKAEQHAREFAAQHGLEVQELPEEGEAA